MTGLRIGRKKQQYVEQCINSQTMRGFQALPRYRKGCGAMRVNEAERGSGQRDRSRHRHRSNRRRKTTFALCREMYGAPAKKIFGPRKPRCVDFIRQTYSKRYDFFDRFRSFSSTAIDRGIGIGRFGVEKATFDFFRKMYGAPAKILFGPRKSRCVDFSKQNQRKR